MYIQVSTTTSTKDEAMHIANDLVNKKLAACVQIISTVESHYVWETANESAVEFLLIIKTNEQLYSAVEHTIKSIHSYTTPEIVAVPIVQGSAEYLQWIKQSLVI